MEFLPLSVPNFGGNEKKYVNDAVVSEWVSTGGSLVGEFEEKIAQYTNMKRAVACNSGTSGLHLAMMVAGIGVGDEVLAPALTFIAAVNPIKYVGATPVFIGCDDTLCMCADTVKRFCENNCDMVDGKLINKKTGSHVKAMTVVHVFGNMANMEMLMDIAKEYNLVLIEDATEALGTYATSGRYEGKMAGTIGDVGVYSFNGNKIITTGSGGMLVSNHDDWAQHAKHLSTQSKTDEVQFFHDEVGYNYRLNNVQAAMGLAQLEQLESFISHKQEIYEMYKQGLDGKNGLKIIPFRDDIRSNTWFYSVYLDDFKMERDELIKYLHSLKIQTRPVWALINEQKPYVNCEAYGMEKAVDYRSKIVNVPCSTNITKENVTRVINAILDI